jgi:hypothetical protein
MIVLRSLPSGAEVILHKHFPVRAFIRGTWRSIRCLEKGQFIAPSGFGVVIDAFLAPHHWNHIRPQINVNRPVVHVLVTFSHCLKSWDMYFHRSSSSSIFAPQFGQYFVSFVT